MGAINGKKSGTEDQVFSPAKGCLSFAGCVW